MPRRSCAHLVHIGLRTFEEAPVDRHLKLFRFLDFTKYVSMLDQRAMFFTRANHLADPFEGSQPRIWAGRTLDVDDAEHRRDRVLVNCWHANEHESATMWRIYLKSDEGVAIQATVERLKALSSRLPTVCTSATRLSGVASSLRFFASARLSNTSVRFAW
jgi:hypothetical protein